MVEKNSGWSKQLILSCVGSLLVTATMADPTDFGDNNVPTSTIEFIEDSDLGGKIARFEGTVTDQGQRLVVKELDVMRPLVVRIFAKDVSKPVDVSLHRYFWGKADAEGSTGSRGDWQYRGRANDEVGIALSVGEEAPVYAFVWQGPAVPSARVPTIVIDSERQVDSAGGTSLMTIGVVGLLLVIAVLLTMLVLRNRRSAAAAILAAALLTLSPSDNPALAQSSGDPPTNPFADEADGSPADTVPDPFADDQKPPGDEFKPEDAPDKPEDTPASGDGKLKPDPNSDKPPDSGAPPRPDGSEDTKLKPDPNADKPNAADTKLKPDPNADKPDTADSKLKPDPNADKPNADSKLKPDPDGTSTADGKPKPDSSDGDDSTSRGESDMGGDNPGTSDSDSAGSADVPFDDRLEAAYDEVRQLRGEIAANAGRIRNLEFLIQQDREAVPEPGDGAPPITVSCEDDNYCQTCLANANENLSNLLVDLDKLRIIYAHYIRYRDYMVGLGDSISGFHQLEQAAWYQTKLQIEEATVRLQRAYDDKFEEFKERLSAALQELSACDSNGGDPTFTRESILFENYVKAKYARDN